MSECQMTRMEREKEKEKKSDRREEVRMEGGPHTMLNYYLHHLMLLCGLRETSNFKIKEMSRGQIVNLWTV